VLYAIAYSSISTLLGIMPGLKAFIAAVLGASAASRRVRGRLIMGQATR